MNVNPVMPRCNLNASFVKKASSAPSRRKTDYFDSRLPGFLLEVRATGGKTYYQRYRDHRGRERQFKIGSAAVLTVAVARRQAKRVLAQALLGDDPHEERKALRKIPTLAQFIREHYLPFAQKAKRSWRTDETILRRHILPALGRYCIDELTGAPIAHLLQKMSDKGYSAGTTNRIIVLLRYIFNLAKKWGVPGAFANPTIGFQTQPDACRQRYLTDDELQRLIAALDRDQNQLAAKAIRLLLLTGARRNEITRARWEHLDWQRKTLLVPMSKTGRPRVITLSSTAIELLRSIVRTDDNPFIFPSAVTGRPCPSLHFPWLRIRREADLLDLRLHDLRHSFASFLVNSGVSLYTVQHLLGHTQPRMTQRYAHLTQQTLGNAAEIVGGLVDAADIPLQPATSVLLPAADETECAEVQQA
jgi:integrase